MIKFSPGKRGLKGLLCAAICLSGAASLLATTAIADEPIPVTTLPGDPITRWTRIHQRQADDAFEKGNYDRAHSVYLKKLAPKGDKHAHYMLGVLNERGLGVPKDSARALAWYALAAERGSSSTRAKAAQFKESLSVEEQRRADEIFAELHLRYGDQWLLVKAIKRDQRELQRRTGTLIPGAKGTSPMYVFSPDG
jgi:hypothetical protein